MPTPARLATASRLASDPPALNTAFAASSTRSRLRTASVRGRLVVLFECSPISFVRFPALLENGGDLRILRRSTSKQGGPAPYPPPRHEAVPAPRGPVP